jgi:hypothetical protein
LAFRLPKSGDQYEVVSEFRAIVSVQFSAPYSDGEIRPLPAGLRFSIWGDTPVNATAASARPIDMKRWEPLLVSDENRHDKLYGGYALVIGLADLAVHCRRI